MADLSLIAELEAAKEGSRELSDEVLLMCGWSYEPNRYGPGGPQWGGGGLWTDPLGIGTAASDPRPSPTESLDAALTLVPEGWIWEISNTVGCGGDVSGGFAWVQPADVRPPGAHHQAKGATPALALCIAALKAREAA